MSKWRDIKSAPKDGSDILTICRHHYSVRYWDEDENGDMVWLPRIRGVFPTHWMPLPNPPEEKK